jgi:hypothetical protein
MKYSMRNPVTLEQQGKSKAVQNTIRDKINIRNPRTQNNDPGRIPAGKPVKKHSNEDCKCCGVDNVFSDHDEREFAGYKMRF